MLVNADYAISPWVTPEDVARDGALVVWSGSEPAALAGFLGDRPRNQLDFLPEHARPDTQTVTMHYVVIPPGEITLPAETPSATTAPP